MWFPPAGCEPGRACRLLLEGVLWGELTCRSVGRRWLQTYELLSVADRRQTVKYGLTVLATTAEYTRLVACCSAPEDQLSQAWRAQLQQSSPLPCRNSTGLNCPKALTRKALPHRTLCPEWRSHHQLCPGSELLFTGVVNIFCPFLWFISKRPGSCF